MSREKCACGCGSLVPDPPYVSGGKNYSSAYCILKESKCCFYCGGYDGEEEFNPDTHDYECRCNFEALDR